MTGFIRISPGVPKECYRNAPRDHLACLIYDEMTPKQKYQFNNSQSRWNASEAGKLVREIAEKTFSSQKIGVVNNFRLIESEAL